MFKGFKSYIFENPERRHFSDSLRTKITSIPCPLLTVSTFSFVHLEFDSEWIQAAIARGKKHCRLQEKNRNRAKSKERKSLILVKKNALIIF